MKETILTKALENKKNRITYKRAFAFIIDYMLMNSVLLRLFNNLELGFESIYHRQIAIIFGFLVYIFICEITTEKTIGRHIMKYKVVNSDLSKLTPYQSTLRQFGTLFEVVLLSPIMALVIGFFTKNSRIIADILSNSYAISDSLYIKLKEKKSGDKSTKYQEYL